MTPYEAINPEAAAAYFESRVNRQIELEAKPPTPTELANKFESTARSSGVFRWFGGIYSPQSPSRIQLDVHLYHNTDLDTDVPTQEAFAELTDIFDDLEQLVMDDVDFRLHFAGGPDQPFDQYRNRLVLSCTPDSIFGPKMVWDENL